MKTIQPDPKHGAAIESGTETDIRCCWTCGSCDFECPVNIATGKLRPQKIVRMANLGLLDELLSLPEIWYCLSCRHCARICPNNVKPSAVIDYVRMTMMVRNLLSRETALRYRSLFSRFQRVRWRAVNACIAGQAPDLDENRWQRWLNTPVSPSLSRVISGNVIAAFTKHRNIMKQTHLTQCFTCGECSSACPIACHRDVFDPRTIIRSVHLGLMEELFRSPAIWLCLVCGRCAEACPQKVDGCAMIRYIREKAIETGAVDQQLIFRLEQADRIIFAWFLDEIDRCLGTSGEASMVG